MKRCSSGLLSSVAVWVVIGCSGSTTHGSQSENPASVPATTVVTPTIEPSSEPQGDDGEPMVVDPPSDRMDEVHAGFEPLPVEGCDVASPSAVPHDLNGDGRPDVVKVVQAGQVRCKVMDLNFDGSFDITEYYDAAGQLRRRDVDFDFDGRPDEVAMHSGGQLIEKRMDSTHDGRMDLREVYVNGRRHRRERDVNDDGRVDEWWTFSETEPDCARVQVDVDGDGRSDRETRVCGN
jgi:hypothetical protein